MQIASPGGKTADFAVVRWFFTPTVSTLVDAVTTSVDAPKCHRDGITTAMKQPITAYHRDDDGDSVAELACGHFQHVRHNPPLVSRPWVTTEAGRTQMLGHLLDCKKCADGYPPDKRP